MRGIILILTWWLPWHSAVAAPWMQEDGGLYVRGALAWEQTQGLTGERGDIYAEYGLNPNTTVTAKIDAVAYDRAPDFNATGWRTTLRRRLIKAGDWDAAIEVGLLDGVAIVGRTGCTRVGGEIRGGLAWSGAFQAQPTFAFAEIAGRVHKNCTRERYALGFGRQTGEDIWSVTQVWFERGGAGARSDKLQSELMWRKAAFDYSIGYRLEFGGAFTEDSVFIALARRY
jgi:hypothetical protein